MGHVTLTTTLLGVFCHPYDGTWHIAYQCTKFDHSSRSTDMLLSTKFYAVYATWPCPFQGLLSEGWYFLRLTWLPNLKSLSPPTTKILKAVQYVEIRVVWGGHESLKVTENSTVQWTAYEFLLAFNNNYIPILHRFWDITRYWSKIYDFSLPHRYLAPSLGDLVGISAQSLASEN